jgi:hypothetical protein
MATSADRPASLPTVLAHAAALAQTMGPDARAYWPRHARRFEFVLRYLQTHTPPPICAAGPTSGCATTQSCSWKCSNTSTCRRAPCSNFSARNWPTEGVLLLTTPNAAWLKNRLKLLRGRNPFEALRPGGGGHIRESTLAELRTATQEAGLECAAARHCGLYGFTGAKDRFYNALANATLPGLRRSLFLVLRKRS